MNSRTANGLWAAIATVAILAPVSAQETLEQRVERLERDSAAIQKENQELKQQLDAVGEEFERFELGDVVPTLGEGQYGLGPAASKIYTIDSGLSIGGYGEFLFQNFQGGADRWDALRAVLYVGYKFDEHWVINTELEFEHGTTASSSGTTDSGGSVSVEFSYLDYLYRDELNARGGLVLVPMGLINEIHEPTTFMTAVRPETERRIIPSTWREMGVGAHGEIAGFAYRTYLMNGMNGEEFDSSGFRGARQKGNRAAASDLAGVLRVDYVGKPGLLVGGSVYYGNSSQETYSEFSLGTTIVEAHIDWRPGPWIFRGLYATSWVSDAEEFNAVNTGANLADRMQGWYLEAGFDVLAAWAPDCGQALTPHVRYEDIDTQYEMPANAVRVAGTDDQIWTVGFDWKPIDQIVVKADYVDRKNNTDHLDIMFGYIF